MDDILPGTGEPEPCIVLQNIAEFVDIPILNMMWLIDEAQLLVALLHILILQPGDIDITHVLFIQQFQMDIEHHNMWTPVILNGLKHIILWFQSYGCTFSECPNANALCTITLCIIPDNFAKSMINNEHDADACTSYIPGCYSFVAPWCSSTRSNCMSGSQTTSKQNVKVSISDYPNFMTSQGLDFYEKSIHQHDIICTT